MKNKAIQILVLMLLNASVFGQSRTIEIFTNEDAAAFIPIINNDQKSQAPVKSYIYQIEKDVPIQVLIHFTDSSTSDIYKYIDFGGSGLKNKKYQIVFKKNAKLIEKLEGINKNKKRPLYDKFEIKDLSFEKYMNDMQK